MHVKSTFPEPGDPQIRPRQATVVLLKYYLSLFDTFSLVRYVHFCGVPLIHSTIVCLLETLPLTHTLNDENGRALDTIIHRYQ